MDVEPSSRRGALAPWLVAALLVVAPLGVVRAQLLADVMVSTAIAAQFDSSVRFPSGSLRAEGAGTAALRARVSDAARWTDWEVYAARGIAAALQPAFVHQVSTAFAVAGYFEASRDETVVNGETRTRIVFEGDAGERLLFVVRSASEVVWLTARSR